MKTRFFAFAFACGLATLLVLVLRTIITQEPDITQPKKKEKVVEPPTFLTAIANDGKLASWQRGIALYLLFERHVEQGISVGELALILKEPMWIKEANVGVVWALSGWIPLKKTPGDTMVCIVLFPNDDVDRHNKECIAIYMNISGEITRQGFFLQLWTREIAKTRIVRSKPGHLVRNGMNTSKRFLARR